MVTIDLLITKDNQEVKLSDFGLLTRDIDESSPSLTADRRTVKNRSGVISAGTQFVEKTVRVVGVFYASSLSSFEQTKEELNALLVDLNPYYITKMLPVNEGLYGFELPGEATGDVDLLEAEHEELKYRWKVYTNGNLAFDFVGRSRRGLLFRFTFNFITAELPFGETEPRTFEITDNFIEYTGTAHNSQLEYPWTLRLIADSEQSGSFSVQIGNRIFEYNSQTDLEVGDEFLLKGVETTKNRVNVNNYTNREHFVLEPQLNNRILFETDFSGTIEILNFVEFYK